MTRLLVSVRDAAEALSAMEGGADIVDLKEPRRGSLGCVGRMECQTILAAMESNRHDRPLLSIAMGELRDFHSPDFHDWPLNRFQFAKIGLASFDSDSEWVVRWRAWRESLPRECAPVAVAYVDPAACAPPPERVIEVATSLGVRHALLDTFDKVPGRGLMDHLQRKELLDLRALAENLSITLVLAGSLNLSQAAELADVGFAIVAVRGAVCDGDRYGTINAVKVAAFRNMLRGMQHAHPRSFEAS